MRRIRKRGITRVEEIHPDDFFDLDLGPIGAFEPGRARYLRALWPKVRAVMLAEAEADGRPAPWAEGAWGAR